MQVENFEKLCDELWDDVECGPGENSIVLRRAQGRLMQILDDPRTTAYVREKVFVAQEQLGIWFSPRKWNKAKDGGVTAKIFLQQDIEKLRQACQVAFKNSGPIS